MDQLVTGRPISASFYLTEDFRNFAKSQYSCLNEVFSGNTISFGFAIHAITITGYGLLNNKFYWLSQNSWGENWCDNGFIKIEIGIMNEFRFSEPYIKPTEVNPVEIEVTFKGILRDCCPEVSTSNSLDNWNNSLEITFTNEKTSENIYFQIGKNKLLGKNVQRV